MLCEIEPFVVTIEPADAVGFAAASRIDPADRSGTVPPTYPIVFLAHPKVVAAMPPHPGRVPILVGQRYRFFDQLKAGSAYRIQVTIAPSESGGGRLVADAVVTTLEGRTMVTFQASYRLMTLPGDLAA